MNSIFAEKLQNNPISWIESSVGVEQPEREAPQQARHGRGERGGGADRTDDGGADEAGGGVQQTVGGSSAAQRSLRGGQRRVVGNIVTNLVTRMQEIAGDFRTSQGNYLWKVEAREVVSASRH